MSSPKAPRATKAGHQHLHAVAVILILGASVSSFFLPKDDWQLTKEKLAANPNDFRQHLQLGQKLLANQQFDEAEKELLLAERINQVSPVPSSDQKVLGAQKETQLEELWQEKHTHDPRDIQQLIVAWEKIIQEKPNYPDAYLQLAVLYLNSGNSQKASESIQKALELDPNNQEAQQLMK